MVELNPGSWPNGEHDHEPALKDWPERFRELSLQEMKYDIQMITCYLPDPWYRVWAMIYITISFLSGFGLVMLGALCGTTVEGFLPYWFMAAGILFLSSGVLVIERYDKWTDDPCSIILDKKMYRLEEEERGAFKSHSRVSIHKPIEVTPKHSMSGENEVIKDDLSHLVPTARF